MVYKALEILREHQRRLRKCHTGLDCPVGRDVHRQTLVVVAVSHTGGIHSVVDLTHRPKGGGHRDLPDDVTGLDPLIGHHVTTTTLDLHLDVQARCLIGDRRQIALGVDHFHIRRADNVRSRDTSRSTCIHPDHTGGVGKIFFFLIVVINANPELFKI